VKLTASLLFDFTVAAQSSCKFIFQKLEHVGIVDTYRLYGITPHFIFVGIKIGKQ
jgi:hypothetical protein